VGARQFLGSIAIAACSAVAGWMLHDRWSANAASPSPAPQAAAAESPKTLLSVMRFPQTVGATAAASGADASQSAAAESGNCPGPEPVASAEEQTQVLRTIQGGTEEGRYEALLKARSANMTVPEETLKTLYETDSSERVRLMAFEAYLEDKSLDPQAQRAALQAALYVPSPAIQAEAKKLLEQMAELERIDAAAQSGSP
jgi:hypothetical protein